MIFGLSDNEVRDLIVLKEIDCSQRHTKSQGTWKVYVSSFFLNYSKASQHFYSYTASLNVWVCVIGVEIFKWFYTLRHNIYVKTIWY